MSGKAREQGRGKSCEVEVNRGQQHYRVAKPKWLNPQTRHD